MKNLEQEVLGPLNPWRDPKIAVLAGQKAAKKWIRQLRGK
jgi:hypothetical protein